MINADAQDLGLTSVKTGKLCLVGRNLIGSYRRPRHGKERKDDMPSAQEARKAHLCIQMAGQGEIRSTLANLKFHGLPPFVK